MLRKTEGSRQKKPERAERRGAESRGAESRGAEKRRAERRRAERPGNRAEKPRKWVKRRLNRADT